MPPCNKAGISNFCLEFQKLKKFQISSKRYSSSQFLFDHSEIFTGETRHIVPPCNKAGISNFCLEFQKLKKFQISSKRYSSFSSYLIILKFLLEKLGNYSATLLQTGILNFCLKFLYSRNSLLLEIAASPSVLVIIYLLTINIKLCRWVSHIKTQVGIDVWVKWTTKVQTVAF